MTTSATFRLSSDELDASFLDKVKSLFAHRDVEIIVREPEMDETDYLSSSIANSEHLDRAIGDIREGRNMVDVDPIIFE